MLVIVDIPAEDETKFRAHCRGNWIDVVSCQSDGPAGGNTRFTVTCDTRESLDALAAFYFGLRA